MKRTLKRYATKILAKKGRRIVRDPLAKYLTDFKIDCVLDVGANKGQFASGIRKDGYTGRIESFEPLSNAIKALKAKCDADSNWNVHPCALGDTTEKREINISTNQPSSSFLELDNASDSSTVDLTYVGKETVQISRLDDVFESVRGNAKHIYLKIDTQGFERSVITGALESLPHIAMVQMELSLVSMYVGEALLDEMVAVMRGHGFSPWWVLGGFQNVDTLQMFQVDVFFANDRNQ